MADEVGLGKTVEAGIVLTQRWAERRRKILLILPATLRKQWETELAEKFAIPSVILEGRKARVDSLGAVVICSYHFAAAHADEIRAVAWDLVVIDEAHRLRNVWKPANKMAQLIAESVASAPKLLLTATPLQNSLIELYGLVSILDPQIFGDLASFRDQFLSSGRAEVTRNLSLKERLQTICIRTLRKQVLEYVKFTQRVPLTQDFLPTDSERELYRQVSDYLQRETLFALPASQRTLLTLVLRKLLASSTFAIAGTLKSLIERLEGQADAPITDDFEELPEIAEEWPAEQPTLEFELAPSSELLQDELAELRRYAALAASIKKNSKGDALLEALQAGLGKASALGAARKAVVFTESRRTQLYLFDLLSEAGYRDRIVLINGSNSDEHSKAIYAGWLTQHKGTSAISGSKTADMKAALVEEFRANATILIATESAAEGVNLQFCSLVINYDLPWNPQRIEQRIGRCHRYGQKHDVVVVNFLNRANAADQRVFELLAQKFRLFEGVFGASDEVLGALESGVDLEKRIAGVYQNCRTESEIQAGFDQLQSELDEQIQLQMASTRKLLLENFDEEVHERLRIRKEEADQWLDERAGWLMALTKQELGAEAVFTATGRFEYSGLVYHADWRDAEALGEEFYRSDHPLAQRLTAEAMQRALPVGHVEFRYGVHGKKISTVQPYVGLSGWMKVSRLTVNSFDCEEHLLLAAITDDGDALDEDVCRKLLSIPAHVISARVADEAGTELGKGLDASATSRLHEVDRRNGIHFEEQVGKLDRWAEDLKSGLERQIKELDLEIRCARREGGLAPTLQGKLEWQKKLRVLEQERTKKRRELFEAQDGIDGRRDMLIGQIEAQMKQTHRTDPVFTVRWTVTG